MPDASPFVLEAPSQPEANCWSRVEGKKYFQTQPHPCTNWEMEVVLLRNPVLGTAMGLLHGDTEPDSRAQAREDGSTTLLRSVCNTKAKHRNKILGSTLQESGLIIQLIV